MWAAQGHALDCSHKPPCPPGTVAQEEVSCEACCVTGYSIDKPDDPVCCPDGTYYVAEVNDCCPDGWILKSDGMCWVQNDADPCTCPNGWHQVAAFSCCPDGKFLSADNPNCCVGTEGSNCCRDYQVFREDAGACVPKKPTSLTIR